MKKRFIAAPLVIALLALPITSNYAFASTATSSDVGVTTPDIYFPSSSVTTSPVVTPPPAPQSFDWSSVGHDVKTGIDIVGELNTAYQIIRFIGGLVA